jgi:hypothetical protein
VPVFWFKAIDPAVQAAIAPAGQAAMLHPGKGTAAAVPIGRANVRTLAPEGRTSGPVAVNETAKLSKVLGH